TGNEQRPGYLHLVRGHDDVEIAELTQRNITIESRSQNWTLIRDYPHLLSIEQIQYLNELGAKEKIVLGICLKPFPERGHCVLWNRIRRHPTEGVIKQRYNAVVMSSMNEKVPVNVLLKKIANSRLAAWTQNHPTTLQ